MRISLKENPVRYTTQVFNLDVMETQKVLPD